MIHRLTKNASFSAALTAVLGLVAIDVFAQESLDEEWRHYQAEEERTFQEEQSELWQSYAREDSLLRAAFRAEVEARWAEFRSSTRKSWVEYENDLSARSIVDFEGGTATLEVLAPEGADPATYETKLADGLHRLASKPASTDEYAGRDRPAALGPSEELGTTALLADQLADDQGNPVAGGEEAALVRQRIQAGDLKQTPVVGKDGVRRVRLTLTIPLVPDHLRRRAERYLPTVREKISSVSRRKRAEPMSVELIMAVMQTESYFNPRARSPVPAFGLMQLVPRSGARDATAYLEGGRGRIVPGQQLYKPDLNIELGTAYLSRLWNDYYGSIEDPESRLYCVIAAYNTGPGNVNRALTPKRGGRGTRSRARFGPAVERVNGEFGSNPSALKSHLMAHLPYAETRDYLRKVSERMGDYVEWGQGAEGAS